MMNRRPKPTSWLMVFCLMGLLLVITCTKKEDPDPVPSPGCTFLAPDEGKVILPGETLTIIVTAEDKNGSISLIRVFLDGAEIASKDSNYCRIDHPTDSMLPGKHIIKAVCTNQLGETGSATRTISVMDKGSPPNAAFSLNHNSAQVLAEIIADASLSSDIEDPPEDLVVRWDWEDDGIWNTPYLLTKTASKAYVDTGLFRIRMEVMDTDGNTDTVTHTVHILIPGQACAGLPTLEYGGQVYHTVKIGQQCWLRENLNIGLMIGGDQEQQDNQLIEKYCVDDNELNCDVYGALYQWDELMAYTATAGTRGICPPGWHVPTDAEWCQLSIHLDPAVSCSTLNVLSGNDCAGRLKETGYAHWAAPNYLASNSSGFTALGSSYHVHDSLVPSGFGHTAHFWTSTSLTDSTALKRLIRNESARIGRFKQHKSFGLSLRCIRDE